MENEEGDNMERWMVTGANGFLGSRITEYYQDKYEITGANHGNLDITDEGAVTSFVKKARPRLVIHCAAISNTGTCQSGQSMPGDGKLSDFHEFGSDLCGKPDHGTGERGEYSGTGQCIRPSQAAG